MVDSREDQTAEARLADWCKSVTFRRHVGVKEIYVFDSFGQTGEPSASLDLLDNLDPQSPQFGVDVSQAPN